MKEKLKITNFAGISQLELDINYITVLIGPQGSGKSISVKLLYFFKSFFTEIIKSVMDEETKRDLDKRQKDKFINFFPKDSWPQGNFNIVYSYGSDDISISKSDNSLKFNYSKGLIAIIGKLKKTYLTEKTSISEDNKKPSFLTNLKIRQKLEACLADSNYGTLAFDQIFIPAGRSFFANMQRSIFSFLSDNSSLDPFLIEFGSVYETFKRNIDEFQSDKPNSIIYKQLCSNIINSEYKRVKNKDFLVHNDKRVVNLSHASSGQQEIFPLLIFLRVLKELSNDSGFTVYIEEPEAHLFPSAQKGIVQLFARLFNEGKSKYQIIITTHSPYILSSFNNLVYAGKLSKLNSSQAEKIATVIPTEEQILPNELGAYSFKNGKANSIIDSESGLISQTILDDISNLISEEFGKLLDIEFDNE